MYILQTLLGAVAFFLVGVFTTITEWKRIHTTPLRKVLYTVTFPLFMLTYIPISMVALFSRRVRWKPLSTTGRTAGVLKPPPAENNRAAIPRRARRDFPVQGARPERSVQGWI